MGAGFHPFCFQRQMEKGYGVRGPLSVVRWGKGLEHGASTRVSVFKFQVSASVFLLPET